ncbi:MAG: molybdopterin molybdotransferase MoeA, partial [Phycisphaerae bacterium]|nr:molybdopterin molybdotransferase MoeA [Phycisphaerae bacterium]MDW8263423.1 molybdopterin molybdotransferase MoeA [Phycisphaerales bacterium]
LMDGFAVHSGDLASAGEVLRVVGEVAAGRRVRRRLARGEAMAIMTGAMLPEGADTVVPVEAASREGSLVRVLQKFSAGHAVAARGSDCPAGVRVLARGPRLEAAQLAVAATVGAARLNVYRPPRAGVLSTGDEVVAIASRPAAHKIRNANNILVSMLLRRLGVEVSGESHVPDDPRRLSSAVSRALKQDLLFISGGLSMGKYDFVPKVLRDLGFHCRITKVRIRPGKPFLFATRDGGPFVFGLPGNPVSAYVCTLRLAARLIKRMLGLPPDPLWLEMPLLEPLAANGPREFYQPAQRQPGGVRPLPWKGSADVFTLAVADGLIVRPENDPARAPGEIVRLLEMS